MKKQMLSVLCLAALMSCPVRATCRCLPISNTTAGFGAAVTGALTWIVANGVAKEGFQSHFGARVSDDFVSLFLGLKVSVPAFSKTTSALLASVAAVPATWLGWKLFRRFTANGYFKRAQKLISADEHSRNLYGRKLQHTELLEIVTDGVEGVATPQELCERVEKLFAMQPNHLAKAANSLENLYNNLLKARDFLYCSRRGLVEDDQVAADFLIDRANNLIDVVWQVSKLIKENPDFQQQYQNDQKERSIAAKREMARAMRSPQHHTVVVR